MENKNAFKHMLMRTASATAIIVAFGTKGISYSKREVMPDGSITQFKTASASNG